MSNPLLKEFVEEFRHTGDEIDLVTYIMPPSKMGQPLWMYLVNLVLPFIRLQEKENYRLFCISKKSRKAYVLHLGVKASELFDKREYELGEITKLRVVPNAKKSEQKVRFDYRGNQESFTLLEYAVMGSWNPEDHQAFGQNCSGIIAELSANAA